MEEVSSSVHLLSLFAGLFSAVVRGHFIFGMLELFRRERYDGTFGTNKTGFLTLKLDFSGKNFFGKFCVELSPHV